MPAFGATVEILRIKPYAELALISTFPILILKFASPLHNCAPFLPGRASMFAGPQNGASPADLHAGCCCEVQLWRRLSRDQRNPSLLFLP